MDSGFSSSSPADRQSPSPKAHLSVPGHEDESGHQLATEPSPMELVLTQKVSSSFHPSKEDIHTNSDCSQTPQSLPSNSTESTSNQTTNLVIKQEAYEQTYSHQSPATLAQLQSLNKPEDTSPCTIHTTSLTSSQSPLQPADSVAAKVYNQPMTIQTQSQIPTVQSHASVEVPSLKTMLESLTSQITGGDVATTGSNVNSKMCGESKGQLEVKVDEDATDAASLIRNNKVAEPPVCSCINRPCENRSFIFYIICYVSHCLRTHDTFL